MALVNSTDLEQLRRSLTTWLSDRGPRWEAVEVAAVDVPGSAGFSNETVFADVTAREAGASVLRRLVIRVEQTGPGLFPTYRLDLQWAILRALHRDGAVPVPAPLWIENDPTVLGGRFYVMDRVEGRACLDDPPYTATGWFMDLESLQRRTVAENGVRAMAQVHATDLEVHDLAVVGRAGTEDHLDREIAYYQDFFAWAANGEDLPTIERGFDWIRSNRPADAGPEVLVWGDARLGNLLVTADLDVSAVLDWEMATIGSPMLDLGWWLFMQRHHTEGYGVPHPDGLPSREETIELYAKYSPFPVEHVDFYEAFAALRGSVIMTRLVHMMIDVGMLPADADLLRNNPGNRILAELTGQPAPAGAGMTGHVTRG